MATTGNDIFGYKRNPKPQNVFSSSESILKFGSAGSTGALGALIQNWNVTYNQNVSEIFELGSDAIYWIKGRPTGAGNVGRVIGMKNVKLFPDDAFDICNGGVTMEIEMSPGKCPGQTATVVTLSVTGVVVTSIGFDANVNNTTINEGLGFRFASLDVKESQT